MSQNRNESRGAFSSGLGFVLASAGSAVGLGNIWRFPYLAAEYGGGIFLLVYVLLAVTFGFSLAAAEIAIGRKTGLSPIGAFGTLDKRFSFIGYLTILMPILVVPYYSVVGGWVLRYAAGFIIGHGEKMANDGYFDMYVSGTFTPILCFAIFVVLTAVTVLFGVKEGVEKISKILMPVLLAVIVFVTVYTLVGLEGAAEGVVYYFKPDLTKLSIKTFVAALGQLFYSMSVSMGVLITFGSYMNKEISITKSVHHIEIFDTGIAVLSGLMIIPVVFAFSGGSAESLGQGTSLMFTTMPKIFAAMPGGNIIGAVFFIMVFIAATTSSIALTEALVSMLVDSFKIKRGLATLVAVALYLALGIPSSLGYGALSGINIFGMKILELFDFLSNNLMMPLIALLTCIFVGWIVKPKTVISEIQLSGKFKKERMFTFVIRYAAPALIVVILFSSLLSVFGLVTI